MNIAYLRISTDRQHLENQELEILKFAESKGIVIDKWHKEVVSGTKEQEERSLGKILQNAKKGDCIIVSEISRLSRRMFDIISILNICIKNKVLLYSVKEGYAIGDDINSKVMGFAFSLSAEIERNLISMRTKEALALRKANGVILGRPKGSCSQQKKLSGNRRDILERIDSKEPLASIARQYNVSRGTLYTFLKANTEITQAQLQLK